MEHISQIVNHIATISSTSKPRTEIVPCEAWRNRWLKLDEKHPEVKSMSIACETLVKRCLRDEWHPRLMVIEGRNGVGKSTASRRAIRAIGLIAVTAWHSGMCKAPPSTAVFAWSTLSGMVPGDRTEATGWVDAVEASALLLDDVGAETDRFKSGQPTENLRLLLEARRDKWTIITTNVPSVNWAQVWDKRVDDRLRRNAVHVCLPTAPSYLTGR